jgi:cyanophycinase-like exopeptidase
MARRLVIMGSGETTPGMLGVHREIFAGLPASPNCRLVDSPFAFQENADELVERIGGYFAESVGTPVRRVHLPAGADALTLERALAEIRASDWVFAGPGSPSYARRCWSGTPVPEALAGVVAPGRAGALVLASAAAVTLGDWALPVYEVYKVGEDPRWEPGLGLMSRVLGWRCAVIPHYDNQEGGTHDTRFCYVGGRRLAQIEPHLVGSFILGVDEHTALLLDLDERTASVAGRGGVTLRVAGVEEVLPSGSRIQIDDLERRVAELGAPGAVPAGPSSGKAALPGSAGDGPLVPKSASTAGSVTPAAASGPLAGSEAVAPLESDQAQPVELARMVLAALPPSAAAERAAVVALADSAQEASVEHSRELAAQVVQALVDVRSDSRAARDWAASDRLRDTLAAVGVEVRDSKEGSTWTWA